MIDDTIEKTKRKLEALELFEILIDFEGVVLDLEKKLKIFKSSCGYVKITE